MDQFSYYCSVSPKGSFRGPRLTLSNCEKGASLANTDSSSSGSLQYADIDNILKMLKLLAQKPSLMTKPRLFNHIVVAVMFSGVNNCASHWKQMPIIIIMTWLTVLDEVCNLTVLAFVSKNKLYTQ